METASEALALSIVEKARIDLSSMANLTDRTQKEIVSELQGVIFRAPNTEPARYEFLSSVAAKLSREDKEYKALQAKIEGIYEKYVQSAD